MRHRSRVPVAVAMLAAVQLVLLSGASGLAGESLITNGDFQKWTDGLPDGWEVDIGAVNGAGQPKSQVKPIKGPALMLRGDASTMAWHTVSQAIPARSGKSYSLEFESRTKDVQQESGQYDNCYVAIMSFDKAGKAVAHKLTDVSADTNDWMKHRVLFAVPQNAESTQVKIFLSKTGILGVKNVVVTEAKAEPAAGDRPATVTKAKPTGLLPNGDFRDWTDGRPDGWKVDIGARNGADEPKSELIQLSDPGLALRGDASTMAWHCLSQELSVRKGKTYTLEFQARSENVRQQGGQYDNCLVGLMSFDANGNRADMPVQDLSRVPRWKKHRIDFRLPPNAETTQVLIFLSKSGTLSVKNLSVKEATPNRPFRGSRR